MRLTILRFARARHDTGTLRLLAAFCVRSRRGLGGTRAPQEEAMMHGLIYLIGLIVVIMAVLSLLGLR
jgi:hypothetical protein